MAVNRRNAKWCGNCIEIRKHLYRKFGRQSFEIIVVKALWLTRLQINLVRQKDISGLC